MTQVEMRGREFELEFSYLQWVEGIKQKIAELEETQGYIRRVWLKEGGIR